MDPIHQTYSDSDFQKFARKFLHSKERKREIIQRALFSSVVSKILVFFRQPPFQIKPINGGRKKFRSLFYHIFWYVLWSMKWMLFFRYSKEEKIITTSFFAEIKSSLTYLDALYSTTIPENVTVVNFGMLYDWSFLLKKKLFCHPYFIEKISIEEIRKEEIANYQSSISNLITKHFPDYLDHNNKKDIRHLMEYYSVVEIFLKKIKLHKQICFYISDTDHLDTRVIICELHKSYGIVTILVDHAINTFSQINNQVYSDQYLCWGDYHKDSYISSIHESAPVSVLMPIGKPLAKFQLNEVTKETKWVYFLPSFQHQTSLTNNRSFDRTKKFVSELNKIIRDFFPDKKLFIKLHPFDMLEFYELFETDVTKGGIDNVLKGSELVFVEDSTIAGELLKYNIPIVYIANNSGNDSLKIDLLKCGNTAVDIDGLHKILEKSITEKIDMKKRQFAFEYYFGNPDQELQKFKNHIINIIPTQKISHQ